MHLKLSPISQIGTLATQGLQYSIRVRIVRNEPIRAIMELRVVCEERGEIVKESPWCNEQLQGNDGNCKNPTEFIEITERGSSDLRVLAPIVVKTKKSKITAVTYVFSTSRVGTFIRRRESLTNANIVPVR